MEKKAKTKEIKLNLPEKELNTVYKYKDIEFRPVKRDLKFHRTEFPFAKKITNGIIDPVTGEISEVKYWEFIHTEGNIKEILDTLVEGDTDKIIIDVENDEDYEDLMILITAVIKDFFLSFQKQKMLSLKI